MSTAQEVNMDNSRDDPFQDSLEEIDWEEVAALADESHVQHQLGDEGNGNDRPPCRYEQFTVSSDSPGA